MQIINSYYDLGQNFYTKQKPDKIKNPTLIAYNKKLATKLNLKLKNDEKYLADIFSGNKLLPNSKPISLAYAGHQFGNFVPQLGDGRAILIGEIKDKQNILHDIQLKGSGRTFFSRGGDGKCPLDAAIREYIVSEAMHFLKIPTTRSLSIVRSDEFIQREGFIPASVITRISKNHIRVGTFEYFAHRGDIKNLKTLADYAINRLNTKYDSKENKYLALLKSAIKSQAELVSSWMSIGFIHGVMNTDNTLISGQTIDYGPCAFMDEYENNKVFSFIDQMGRYSFANQKNIILWNLSKFAGSILPLIDNDIKKAINIAENELNKFPNLFEKIYYKKMAKKIGIFNFKNNKEDKNLIDDFLKILEKNNIDYTNGFRRLSNNLVAQEPSTETDWLIGWQKKWINRLQNQTRDLNIIATKMNKVNPILIPRNHIIAGIIQKSVFQNNYDEFHTFLKAIEKPFAENTKYKKYYLPPKPNEKVINTFCGT